MSNASISFQTILHGEKQKTVERARRYCLPKEISGTKGTILLSNDLY